MEFYLKELVDASRKSNICVEINFQGTILSVDTYDASEYIESEQRQIIERLFFKCIDWICDHPESSLWILVLDHLYNGSYKCLSINVKSYLFESLELCSPRHFLVWIDKILDNEEEMSKINIQAFTTYVDAKRKRGSTYGEIRYTLMCESSATLLELILSRMYRDRSVSKHVWFAIFRLKQHMSITSVQKDVFNEWLGIV
jgi:hypothetical protein